MDFSIAARYFILTRRARANSRFPDWWRLSKSSATSSISSRMFERMSRSSTWVLACSTCKFSQLLIHNHLSSTLTSSFFSIISSRNSGSVIVLSSGKITPSSPSKYSPRSKGVWRVLYALFINELHSELNFCSSSLFPENKSGWTWLWNSLNFFVRPFASILCCFPISNRSK